MADRSSRPDRDRPVRVRPFTHADRDAVLNLAPRLTIGIAPWRDPAIFLATARTWIAGSIDGIGPTGAVFVAEDSDRRCLGFVSVARNVHFTGEEQAYIGELAVATVAEGQGVGRALLAAAENWAREQGYGLVVLDTGAANTRARTFYERAGYAEESVKLVKTLQPAAAPEAGGAGE